MPHELAATHGEAGKALDAEDVKAALENGRREHEERLPMWGFALVGIRPCGDSPFTLGRNAL